MRRDSGLALLLTTVVVLLAPGRSLAANAITWSNSSAEDGYVAGNGTYTLDTGWSVSGITLIAYPTVGGAQISGACTFANNAWGPKQLNGLTTGTEYTVFAQMVVTNGVNMQTINTSIVKLTPRHQAAIASRE